MRLKLVLGFAIAIAATPALAETRKPVAGEADTYIDADFTRVDQQTGLVVLRTVIGKPSGANYSEWADKEPIVMSAIDCKADTFKDLGLDFDNAATLPDGWRSRRSQSGAKIAVGGAGVAACKARGTLQTAALP